MRFLVVVFSFSFLACAGSVRAQERPNIVLVMADDQGWGDMAYNGHPHLKTPNFDALAKEGIRFDRFHAAAPVCSPTRGSVMTGRHPNRFGCFQWGHPLRPQEFTLAQALKNAGYRTGHFGKWHLGSMQKDGKSNPGSSGFDKWVSAPNFFDLNPILSSNGKAVPFQGDSSDVTVDQALQFIEDCTKTKEPFLTVIWFGSPHDPHQALEADRKHFADLPPAQQHFFGEIFAMDRAFGKLRQKLRELGLRDNTLVWYCSDNGALPKVGSTGGRRGFKGSIYEGGLLVPGLLEWPGKVHAPRVVDLPCITSDIFATVLEIAKAQPAPQRPIDGISLLPLLEGRMKQRDKGIGFWNFPAAGSGVPAKAWMEELHQAQLQGKEPNDPKKLFSDAGKIKDYDLKNGFPGHSAWLEGQLKLHRIEDKNGRVTWEFYDLGQDPKESKDLSMAKADLVPPLRRDLEAWLASVVNSLKGMDYGRK